MASNALFTKGGPGGPGRPKGGRHGETHWAIQLHFVKTNRAVEEAARK